MVYFSSAQPKVPRMAEAGMQSCEPPLAHLPAEEARCPLTPALSCSQASALLCTVVGTSRALVSTVFNEPQDTVATVSSGCPFANCSGDSDNAVPVSGQRRCISVAAAGARRASLGPAWVLVLGTGSLGFEWEQGGPGREWLGHRHHLGTLAHIYIGLLEWAGARVAL